MPTRILLVGAGSIGAFFSSRLATVSDVLVSALCRSNYKAVKANGLQITSPYYGDYIFKPEHTFAHPAEVRLTKRELGLDWDYLLVATKALPDVSDDSALLEGLVGEETSILLVQNGISIEEPYRKRFPNATILSAVTNASAAQPKPGVIKHNRWTKISIGPYLPRQDSGGDGGAHEGDRVAKERNAKFVQLLKDAGISDAEAFDHAGLQFVRWHKIAINAAMNPSSVLSGGCGNQALSTDPELSLHTRAVMDEVLSTAPKILNKPFPMKQLKLASTEQVLESVSKNTSGSRPSMWQDWERGQKMELEVILGNPVRMAREKGLDMPRLQSMYALLKMAQERREAEIAKESKL